MKEFGVNFRHVSTTSNLSAHTNAPNHFPKSFQILPVIVEPRETRRSKTNVRCGQIGTKKKASSNYFLTKNSQPFKNTHRENTKLLPLSTDAKLFTTIKQKEIYTHTQHDYENVRDYFHLL